MEQIKNSLTTEEKRKVDQNLAADSLRKLSSVLDKIELDDSDEIQIKIQDTGDVIPIPGKALILFASILEKLAAGKSISIISSESEISTQEAANMINISRPHLIKLLESGAIPFRKVGSHRRVLLEDMMVYEKKLRFEREKKLEVLARQAQELNLGYE